MTYYCKMKKKVFLLLIIFFLVNTFIDLFAQDLNKDEIYENNFRPDLPRSMQDIPYEDQDYKKTHYSPYAELRIGKACKVADDILPPGIYLVKPFTKANKNFILIKKKDSAIALAPILSKTLLLKKVKSSNLTSYEEQNGKYYMLDLDYDIYNYKCRLTILNP